MDIQMIPLKQVNFQVSLAQGFADMVVHQRYVNELDEPVEIQFCMPTGQSFTVGQIIVDFTLEDGTEERLQTRIVERERAAEQYEDSQAEGKTAVFATLPPPSKEYQSESMMKIRLGNMPANCSAIVRTFCHQKLEVEDFSYCFRLPMAFVPPYMGNASKALLDDPSLL